MKVRATQAVQEFAQAKGAPVRKRPKVRKDRFTWNPDDVVEVK